MSLKWQQLFLDVSSHSYKRVCPFFCWSIGPSRRSVRQSVSQSVSFSFVKSMEINIFKKISAGGLVGLIASLHFIKLSIRAFVCRSISLPVTLPFKAKGRKEEFQVITSSCNHSINIRMHC